MNNTILVIVAALIFMSVPRQSYAQYVCGGEKRFAPADNHGWIIFFKNDANLNIDMTIGDQHVLFEVENGKAYNLDKNKNRYPGEGANSFEIPGEYTSVVGADGVCKLEVKVREDDGKGMCWIERIQKYNGGMNVHFIKNAHLIVHVQSMVYVESGNKINLSYIVDGGLVYPFPFSPEGERPKGVDQIFVKDGYIMNLSQGFEATCTATAEVNDNRAGLHAHAEMHLSGVSASSRSAFMKASDLPQ